MAIKSYINGAGGSTGADLATLKRTVKSGVYWYLGNATSGNSDSNDGRERTAPLSTIAQAHSNASAGDEIVVLSGHNETISTVVTFNKANLSVVGEGTGTSRPRFTNGVAAATNPMFVVSAGQVLFDTLYFPGSSVVARERIEVLGGSGTSVLRNLEFECSANDSSNTLVYASTGPDYFYNLRFTATGAAAGPAISAAGTGPLIGDTLYFDGGSYGWTTSGAMNASNAMHFRLTRVYQYNGSNIIIATGNTGTIQVQGSSGDSRVDWTV